MPAGKDVEARVDAVLEIIYLLFNEAYSASTGDEVIRFELCEEAIRLAEIMGAHQAIRNKSNTWAVLALRYLNASRFNPEAA